jgi:hypothetical protein
LTVKIPDVDFPHKPPCLDGSGSQKRMEKITEDTRRDSLAFRDSVGQESHLNASLRVQTKNYLFSGHLTSQIIRVPGFQISGTSTPFPPNNLPSYSPPECRLTPRPTSLIPKSPMYPLRDSF